MQRTSCLGAAAENRKGTPSILHCLFSDSSAEMVRRRPLPPPGVRRKCLGGGAVKHLARDSGQLASKISKERMASGSAHLPVAWHVLGCAFKHSAHAQLQGWLRQRGLRVQRGVETGDRVFREEVSSPSPSSVAFGKQPLKRQSISLYPDDALWS